MSDAGQHVDEISFGGRPPGAAPRRGTARWIGAGVVVAVIAALVVWQRQPPATVPHPGRPTPRAELLPTGGRSWTLDDQRRFAFVLPVTNRDQFPADVSAVSADTPSEFDSVEVGITAGSADTADVGTVLNQQVRLIPGEAASIVIRGVISCPVAKLASEQPIYLTVDGQHTELNVGPTGEGWQNDIVVEACRRS